MTLSGTKVFEPDIAEYIEEAFERCGLEVRTGYDLRTARRSLNLMFAEWANRGFNYWTVQTNTEPALAGVGEYTLTADTVDVVGVLLRTGSVDRVLSRVSRQNYFALSNKAQPGTPSQFYVDRTIVPTLKIWPLPLDSSSSIVFERLVRIDDANYSSQTVEVPFRFYPVLAAGLAYYIALKRAPDRVAMLEMAYEKEFKRAIDEDRDRASLFIVPPRGYGRI